MKKEIKTGAKIIEDSYSEGLFWWRHLREKKRMEMMNKRWLALDEVKLTKKDFLPIVIGAPVGKFKFKRKK